MEKTTLREELEENYVKRGFDKKHKIITCGLEEMVKFIEKRERKKKIDFDNKLWEIGADIMKMAGVKRIKTSYKN